MAPAKYACGLCGENAEEDVIECSLCNEWIYRQCIPLYCKQMMEYKSKCLQFYCKFCSFVIGSFNFRKSLEMYETTCINIHLYYAKL